MPFSFVASAQKPAQKMKLMADELCFVAALAYAMLVDGSVQRRERFAFRSLFSVATVRFRSDLDDREFQRTRDGRVTF